MEEVFLEIKCSLYDVHSDLRVGCGEAFNELSVALPVPTRAATADAVRQGNGMRRALQLSDCLKC